MWTVAAVKAQDADTMAALSGFMNALWPFFIFNKPSVRRSLPAIFFFLTVGGSLLQTLDVVPDTYFSNSRNVVNLYFVKLSWGWTLFLLLPFILLSNSINKNLSFVFKRLMCLIVATLIWYICIESFSHFEDWYGNCYESSSLKNTQEGISTKTECKKAGLFWVGFDISGHSFILSYSSLLIVEEMASMPHPVQHFHKGHSVLNIFYIALNIILFIWLWMFACTSVYFHSFLQKLFGTSFGVLSWYMTYRAWYPYSWSPGLPPHPSEHKQQ